MSEQSEATKRCHALSESQELLEDMNQKLSFYEFRWIHDLLSHLNVVVQRCEDRDPYHFMEMVNVEVHYASGFLRKLFDSLVDKRRKEQLKSQLEEREKKN